MLWGAHAQAKRALLGGKSHCVLEAPHPSPLSAHRGFLGCGHFALANEFLEAHGRQTIDWRLPETGEVFA
jgi:uracil-DNA glycosylase